MYFGEKPRKGLSKFVAVLTALAIASASLLAVPAYAAESGAENQNPVMEFFGNVADGAAQLFGLGDDGIETYAVEGADTVVDPNTTNVWSNIATSSKDTQNVGRIWTDKSVFNDDYSFEGTLQGQSISKGDSDFLVGLSAMSSTSNVRSMVTRTQPLDIVLIIDRSSSMNEDIEQAGSYVEVPAENVEEAAGYLEWHNGFMGLGQGNEAHQTSGVNEYYALVDGEYVRINEETTTHSGDGWYSNTSYEEHIRWTLNGQTVTPEDTKFYEYQQGGTISRMEALKTAANNFIDSAAGLPNSEQVRIGIISFAGDSADDWDSANINQQFTNLSGNNAQTLKNTVNRINAPGSGAGTYPANAFQDAQSMFNGSAQGTQKVVVFFTDGGPGGTTNSVLSNEVARQAIQAAQPLKASGTTIYSVGVLDGADPTMDISSVSNNSNSTLRVNAYMHAVSSNYPHATGFTSNTIGNRAQNSDYYKAATNASELNTIFNDIFEEIENNQGSGSPIEEEVSSDGAQNTPGDLVFEDQLGSYMQVTGDKMTLVYADGKHESVRSETQGNITTYHFEGTFAGNAIYGEADYSDISVQVEHSDDLATGDKVTVTIPASLIPMRSYNVDTESDTPTMTITDAYPVRLFYGVSLKKDAVDAINDGSGADYDAIMSSQVSEDGTIDFYSNVHAGSESNGLTTATFTPNEANKFYYYTQDTTLYVNQDCTIAATPWNSSNVDTFYYAEPYWERNSDGTAVEHTEGVAIIRDSLDFESVEINARNELYIPAHTARQDRPHTLDVTKSPNETGTAPSVLVPAWNGGNESVTQHLGNNGKLSLPAPGSFQITKTVDWGNASDETKASKNSFTFHVSLTDASGAALKGTYAYTVTGTGAAEGQGGTVSNGGEIALADGQTATVTGLPNAAKFEVVEDMVSGFTITDDTGDTTDRTVEGTIASGETASATFTNRYHADAVDLSDANVTLSAHKELKGRGWREDDEFRFLLSGNKLTTRIVDITDETPGYTEAFRDVTFDAPGTYTLTITEDNDYEPVTGINYSGATFTVTVQVEDDGEGKLYIPENGVSIQQTRPDSEGAEMNGVDSDTNTVTFVNTYDAENDEVIIDGTKHYTDTTGNNPITTNKFTFQLEAVGGYKTDDASVAVAAEDVPMPVSAADANTSTTNIDATTATGGTFQFDAIPFNGDNVGYTYTYRVTEVAGTEQGMQYNTANASYELTIVVTEDASHVIATPSLPPSDVVFTNVYDPEDATLAGDEAIHGTKTLTGRNLNDGEKFYFTLTQTGGPATPDPDDAADAYTVVLSQPETVAVDSLTNGSADFSFGDLSFPQVGTYTFTVDETAADGSDTADGNGLTYSQNVATVTVDVTDGGEGELVAKATYSNKIGDATDKAVFTNVYKSSMSYGAGGAGGINVTKQLNGRPMAANEFTFTIAGQGDAADMTTDLDRKFKNTGAAEGRTITMKKLQSLTFDQDDAGKTFTFIVDETEGNAAETKVDYDQSQYQVVIAVYDDGLGTMHTVTNVTKIKDADGKTVSEPVVTNADTSADGYTVPTFGFVNAYTPDPVVVGEDAKNAIQVTKTVTGAPSPDGVNYGFTMTLTSDNADGIANGMTANDEGKLEAHVATSGTIETDSSQTVSFGSITFSKPGTYTFDVTEDTPAPDDGWSYDTVNTGAKTVTVVVSNMNEQGQYDGSLHVQSVTGNPVQVTNAYKPGEVIVGGEGAEKQITVQKTVTGADSAADFTFQLEPVIDDTHTNEWWASRIEAVDPNYNGRETIAGGLSADQTKTVSFDGVKFKQVGEYKFKVAEVGAADFNAGADRKGWTYDEHTATVTVKVTDEGNDGQLDAEVVYDNTNATTEADKSAQAAAFTNKYVPAEVTTGDDAQTDIQVTKKVTGHDAIEPFEFSLSLKDGQNGDAVFEGAGENKAKFDGMTLTTSDSIKAGATETKTFDDITFTAAGDYTFVIDETTTKTDAGWTYDTSTHEVTVHVKDNGEGALYIESIEGNAPEFDNIYKLTPGKFRAAFFKLQGNKVLDGRNWKAGDEFTFTLTAGEGENVDGTKMADGEVAATMPAKTTDTIKPMEDDSKVSDNSAQFTFTSDRIPGGSTVEEDTFTYSKPGTYRYLIRETNPNVAAAGSGILGVSYDQTVYRLTVVVTDKGDGTLDAKGTYTKQEANGEWTELGGSDQIIFTNTYSSDKVNITFNAFKVLQNRETAMKDNEFTFHMEFAGWKANDDQSDNWSMDGEVAEKAPAPAADKGNIIRGDVTFAGMDFTADQVGYTYRYAITEVNGGQTINGVTLDDSTHYVTAKVTSVQQENEDGTFTEHVRVETSGEAEWNEQDDTAPTTGAIFINTYDPGETTVDTGEADFDLTKILKGKDWNGDKFTFTISPVSAMNDDQEIIAADSPDFPMPAETTLTVDAATGEDKDGNDLAVFSFGNIKYDQEGVYTYTVEEKIPVEGEEGYNAGITYSKNEATVVVTVTDNNEGGYTTAVNITNNEFVNEYHTKADYNANGAGGLDITKQVTNHAMEDGQFSFTIEAIGDNAEAAAKKLGIQDGTTTTVESAQAAAGVVTSVKNNPFETIKFDKSDDGVTYTYTIKENGKSGEGDYKNYVLDTNTYTVAITPTDNGDGTMTVKTVVNGTEYSNERATVAFVNSYKADPTTVGAQRDATIKGTKTLKNDDLIDDQFTFQVKSGDVVVATGTNDANGNITFGDITYTTENLAAAVTPEGSDEVGTATAKTTDAVTVYTFKYTVSEVNPDPNQSTGVTANTGAQSITVTVTDDGNGKLTPVVTYGDGDPLAFVNTYGGDADFPLGITGTKEIVGGQTNPTNIPTLKGGEYEFAITGSPAEDGTPAPMPAKTTVKNDAAGGVTFEDIHYTMENTFGNKPATTNADAEAAADEATTDEATTDEGIETYTADRIQVFTYTISESGSVNGVTNEQGTKTVQVTVTDLGGGNLKAEVTSQKVDGADFKFTNVYDVTETTSSLTGEGGFTITKDFKSTNTDRVLAEGDFEFQLKGGDTVITATNAADGTVSFGGITFTKPGTYNYVLSEVDGGKPGVDYDTTGYNVTAKAEDQGDGTLKVTWEMPQAIDGGVTFTNTYTAANTGITFEAAKVLDGRELKDGEFTFELRENGKVIDTATNDADGTVAFEKVEYTEPGAHDYEIAEVKGDDSTITYDDTVFTVHVNVVDNTQTGSLDASDWSYGENGAPVFHNTYTKPAEPPAPEEPKPEEPKPEVIPATGDAAAAAVMATAGIGAALAAAGYVTSKKRGE